MVRVHLHAVHARQTLLSVADSRQRQVRPTDGTNPGTTQLCEKIGPRQTPHEVIEALLQRQRRVVERLRRCKGRVATIGSRLLHTHTRASRVSACVAGLGGTFKL